MEENSKSKGEQHSDKGIEIEALPGEQTEGKKVLMLLAVVVGIFVLFIGGITTYNHFTTAAVVDVDKLHQENLAGDLNKDEGYVYNGYSFVKADGLWWTEMNKFGTRLKIPLHFGPKELESVPVKGSLDPQFNEGDQIFIAIDPDVRDKYYTLAISELSFNVVKGLDREPVGSCTAENWACDNRTIISCAHNPEKKPVIELVNNGTAGLELAGTCIKITGSKEYEIVKATNRLLYQWYGVMR